MKEQLHRISRVTSVASGMSLLLFWSSASALSPNSCPGKIDDLIAKTELALSESNAGDVDIKIAVVIDSETASSEAQSSLVKTLIKAQEKLAEEKPDQAVKRLGHFQKRVLKRLARGELDLGEPPEPDLLWEAEVATACIKGILPGPQEALATTVVDDIYIADEVFAEEYSEDVFGRLIQRTSVEIVFYTDTTVGEINDLLLEFSAKIIATLAGYPSVVVSIPDPATLQALDTIIADITSRGPVYSVTKAIQSVTHSLPLNVEQRIFNTGQPNPLTAPQWQYIDQHLAVRGAAAWGLQSLIKQKPVVMMRDEFGDGDPDLTAYDIDRVRGLTDFGISKDGYDFHGYLMLSMIAAKHSGPYDVFFDYEFATGMVPGGIRLNVVDMKRVSPLSAAKELTQKLKVAINSSTLPVIFNISMGIDCTNTKAGEPCRQGTAELITPMVNFRREIRHIGAEHRALFVVSAGNRIPVTVNDPATKYMGPFDADTSSDWTASTLLGDYFDPVTNTVQSPLANVLIVENAEQDRTSPPPFGPGCITTSSFVGGHLAGIGRDIFGIISPSNATVSQITHDGKNSLLTGGTSSATAQVTGVAAYLSAIRADLTPQDLMTILTKTGGPLSGSGGTCTKLPTTVPLVDAYAAVLATDPPGQINPQSAKARLKLLDIYPDNPNEDGVFDILDLQRWIIRLDDPAFPNGQVNYGRFDVDGDGNTDGPGLDLNGDGTTGGFGTDRFDLDISMNPGSGNSSPFGVVQYDFLGSPITYSEDLLTDIQIVCYYANSDLYNIGLVDPFTAAARDLELEKVKTLCDPCLASAAPVSSSTTVGLSSAQAIAPDTCEEPGPGKIAYLYHSGGIQDIAVMDADGSNWQNLTDDGNDEGDYHPSWSPDGAQIAFASRRDGNGRSEIYVMDANGGNQERLTDNSWDDDFPAWSPDGTKIAFRAASEIYVMNADGTDPQNLTKNPSSLHYHPSWSPDGAQIAFTSNRDDLVYPYTDFDIYVMNADGTDPVRITFDGGSAYPAWSPDGAKIAFSTSRDGNGEIYVMDADGSNPQNLTNHPLGDSDPAWKPDGSKITWSAWRDCNRQIFSMNADGSNPQNLTNYCGANSQPSWSP